TVGTPIAGQSATIGAAVSAAGYQCRLSRSVPRSIHSCWYGPGSGAGWFGSRWFGTPIAYGRSLYRWVARRPVQCPFMKPTEIAALRVPGRPTLSPDGRQVIVSVSYPDLAADAYAAHLWLARTDGAAPARQLTHGWRDGEPVWSPDGRWVAFTRAERDPANGEVGKPQLWVLPACGGEPRRLTDHPLGVSAPVWIPDATKLAYLARVPEPSRYGTDDQVAPDAEPPRRITSFRYRWDDIGFIIGRRSHVWTVDITGGEPVRVTDGDADHTGVDWSPDGDLLAFAAARHPGAG